jgi:hypothetical protein
MRAPVVAWRDHADLPPPARSAQRQRVVAVSPEAPSRAQAEALKAAVEYGKSFGVTVKFTSMK